MKENERVKAAKVFAEYWANKGYEKGESQSFWLSFLRDILGVEQPEKFIRFEQKVVIDNTSFIDGIIDETHVLIEQKSADKSLTKPIKQRPRWIITCNFQEFLIYDMEKPTGEPESILLKDLPKEYYRFQFITDTGNENIKKEMEKYLFNF